MTPRTSPRTAYAYTQGGGFVTLSGQRNWGGRTRTYNFLINSQLFRATGQRHGPTPAGKTRPSIEGTRHRSDAEASGISRTTPRTAPWTPGEQGGQ